MDLMPNAPALPMRTAMQTPAPTDFEGARRREALEGLEAMFINLLLQEMRKSIPDDGVLARSSGQKQMESLMDEYLAREMAKTGQFGIARAVEQQLQRAEGAFEAGMLKSPVARADKVPDGPMPGRNAV